ncbi:MAG: DUF3054 domain-containing protein [Gammaproteobacteria bacterium]|jgi:hypothetical protein|nr:DUF3054 domain-containing protein [Gammaproteobacteria bacterium]
MILLDLLAVLIFVSVGRDVHGHVDNLAGIASTAWPFATGVVVGWLVTRHWRSPLGWSAVIVWLATVAVGMTLRVVTNQGIAIPFIFVSLGYFALTELGWRIAGVSWLRWRRRSPS